MFITFEEAMQIGCGCFPILFVFCGYGKYNLILTCYYFRTVALFLAVISVGISIQSRVYFTF